MSDYLIKINPLKATIVDLMGNDKTITVGNEVVFNFEFEGKPPDVDWKEIIAKYEAAFAVRRKTQKPS